MQEILQSNIRIIVLAAILCGMLLLEGCQGTKSDNKEGVELPEVENDLENKEGGNSLMNDELVLKISEFLGCGSKTSESIFKTLDCYIEGTIIDIEKKESNVRKRLKVKDDMGQEYLVVVGRGYFVETIYRNDENGEKIYRAIQ